MPRTPNQLVKARMRHGAPLPSIPSITLTDADWSAVHELVARKYGAWSWNYGENPPANVQRAQRFPAGEIDVRIDVQEGRIAGIRFFGDYMGREDVGTLETMLLGIPYDRPAIQSALAGVDIPAYFGDVNADDVLGLIAP